MDLMRVYRCMPYPIQNVLCSIQGYKIQRTRYNDDFWKMLNAFEERASWKSDEVNKYRDQKLIQLIHHAITTVPFYRQYAKEKGLTVNDFVAFEDLKKLPIVTKEMINENPEMFYSDKLNEYDICHVHSSGTTGSGFKIITTYESIHAQWATFWRHRRKLGIDFDMWQLSFASREAVPIKRMRPPFWRYDYPGKRIYFSAFHESEENLAFYYKKILDSHIEWIHGYPSLINLLADYMIKNNLSFTHVKYVTTGAENLLDYQIRNIKQAFGVSPIQVYGQTENVAIFSQESDGTIVIDEDFAAVELLENEYGTCDVIGTNLYNYAMPLIRYKTKDTVEYKMCPDGRRIIEKIDGREEDYVSLPNGVKVGKLDHVFKDTINFKEAQLFQRKDYSIVVNVVGEKDKCIGDEKMALKLLRESLGDEVLIEFNYVDKIARTANAKLRFVISEV